MVHSLLPILALLAAPPPAPAPAPAPAADRHVVVITIDGLPGSYLDDPKASLPVLRGLARAGASATGGLLVSNPSVTWPNHTTLMTGVRPETHGVLFNGVLDRGKPGEPLKVDAARPQADLVRVPLLFDVLADHGLSSAAIFWPCTRGSKSIGDNFPDVTDSLDYTTPRIKDELKAAGLLDRFDGSGWLVRDEIWTEAACRTLRERKPALLALHLLNLDGTHHAHGPQSDPGYTAAALCDGQVGRVLAALDQAGIRDRTTVFVVSDHGFMAVTKSLRPNALLRRAGLLETSADAKGREQITRARVQVIPEGGIGMVYLTDPATADQDRATVRRLFREAEGVAALLEPEDFPRLGLPRPGDHPSMADLILAAKPGYAVAASAEGDQFVVPGKTTTGSHGYLATEPGMNGTFVVAGAGIKPGAKLATVDNVDVAPTVAHLLGVTIPGATGRVIGPILDPAPTQSR